LPFDIDPLGDPQSPATDSMRWTTACPDRYRAARRWSFHGSPPAAGGGGWCRPAVGRRRVGRL